MGKVSKVGGGPIGGESWIVPSGMVLKLPDGLVGTPSLTFTSDTDTGLYRIGTDEIGITLGGTLLYDFSSTAFTINSDLLLTREAAAILQLGADAAGVTNQMFKGPDRITSDGVGGNLTIAGGRNRGASVGGSIIFQTSPATGAGVTGTLATVLTLASDKSAVFTGAITTTNLTNSGLTITRIPFASTGGLLIDDADLTFATDTLSATKLISSTSITSPQIYGSSAGSGTLTLTSTSHGTKGTISVGRLTLSDLANADGIIFASLGTATKAIDLNASGLSGATDYWIYANTENYWTASGTLILGSTISTHSVNGYSNDDCMISPAVQRETGFIISTTNSILLGNGSALGPFTTCTFPTANKDYINRTGIGTGLSNIGNLVHVQAGTGATKGYYRVIALISANSIQVDRNIHAAGADITDGTVNVFKDVISIHATDATNGQMLTSWSAQNKPLQIGGTVLAATATLTSTDIVIGGNIGLSQTQAASDQAGTLATVHTAGNPGIYFKVIDPATGTAYAVPGWAIP